MSSPESKGERGEGPGQGPELKFAAARFISTLGTDPLLYLRPGDLKKWVWGEAGGISVTVSRGRSSGLQTFWPRPDLLKRKRFAPARSDAGAGSHHLREPPTSPPGSLCLLCCPVEPYTGGKDSSLNSHPSPEPSPQRHDSRHVAETRELETEVGDGLNLPTRQRKHLQISKRGNPLALGYPETSTNTHDSGPQ